VISEKQRRRALARAKWERQNSRRESARKRNQQLTVILGTVCVVVLIAFAGWGVHHLATDDSDSPNAPAITYKTPTNPAFSTIYSPPTTTAPTSSGATTGSGTTSTTAPTTAETTR